VVASSTAVSDPTGARRLGRASIGVSVAGIIVTVVVIVIAIAVAIGSTYGDSSYYCRYTYYGTCYRSRDYVGKYGFCSGVKSTSGYCYYN